MGTNNNVTFQLKRTIKDIKSYNKDYYYAATFNIYISTLNQYALQLNLPSFNFEKFHYSSTAKTINETGYSSLMNHIETLEEMLPNIKDHNSEYINKASSRTQNKDTNKIFIVHGRDTKALLETEGILYRDGFEPVVLNRLNNRGMTLIEKFEKYSNVQYAVVLLTPDDVGSIYDKDLNPHLQFRARQNVLFELGFFYGKLGRANVCCLLKQTVEKPTDIDGIAYIPFNNSIEEIEYKLLNEIKEANLSIKL